MGLAYCSRSWGRLDSGICEPREYGEAHKWGTWGGWRSYLLVVFFCFVIMRSLFIRYKKPHAALAMERTKPINQ